METGIMALIEANQQKLQQYEQVLTQEIQHEYPLRDESREDLRRYQQALDLSEEEIARIEERVLKNREVQQRQQPSSGATDQPFQHVISIPPSQNPTSQNLPATESNTLKPVAWKFGLGFAAATIAIGILVNSQIQKSDSPFPSNTASSATTTTATTTTTSDAKGLKIGSLLPATGDLASIGQQMAGSVPLLVDTVNACGGVNGAPAPYTPHAWDAAALLVLSAQAAKQNTGVGIANKIREVANGPGTEVSDVCEGLKLLKNGKKINYQGASGNVDVDQNGDVIGVYDVWTIGEDGKTKTIGKVNPRP